MVKIYVLFTPLFICNSMFPRGHAALYRGYREERMICAGATVGDSNTCQVFRKTPQEKKCLYDIIGVASYVVCGLPDSFPVSIYTRISYYLEWIEETVWEDSIV